MAGIITRVVTLVSINFFDRENTHVKLRFPEQFACITMRDPQTGEFFVTFTRVGAEFCTQTTDRLMKTGEGANNTYEVTGKFKRVQEYGPGTQTVLTNCVYGKYAFQATDEKKAAKKAARMAKLGL